ncbi:MAG: acetyl-CoA carboxylase carboxyltransferase subunit alpha [Acidobacteriota bacterium]
MPKEYIDLEAPIIELRDAIENLKKSNSPDDLKKLQRLKEELKKEWEKIKTLLTPWQVVQLARHPMRPYTLDYIGYLFDDFLEIHGDRRFADDPAIVAGLASYKGQTVTVVGHQKGRTTKEKIFRNFGMPNPEGYRKALRVMKLGEKFGFPVVSFIDTPGAYAGVGAEERGQAEAIAYNLREMSRLKVPVIIFVIGEGGSGGALAIGIGDLIYMLEFSIYSVISPEGCAAILWKNQSAIENAADNLKPTAKELKKFEIIDEIVPEPPGGSHSDYEEMAKIIDSYLEKGLKELSRIPFEERINRRIDKFRKMGVFIQQKEAIN